MGSPIVSRRYIDRIYNIQRTDYFRELFNFSAWRLHPLHGEYAGRFSISLTGSLTGRYRLIVGRGYGDDHVVIYEVTNHYDD